MNKIIMQFGLLVFFLSIVFFIQREIQIIEVLIRSAIVSVVLTIMITLLALAFIKAINKVAIVRDTKEDILEENEEIIK
ncbi:MAG: hypothetical protein C0425_02105 [Chlorobiaceae bacterium]|nr:hypothetical protein [Chlorobiaceae bacterium]MBA4309112.1 hypothetical protein [Chlorobiaceae bacterium]